MMGDALISIIPSIRRKVQPRYTYRFTEPFKFHDNYLKELAKPPPILILMHRNILSYIYRNP